MKNFFWLTSLTLVMFFAGGCGGGPTGMTKEPVRPVSVRRVSMDEAKTMMATEFVSLMKPLPKHLPLG